MAGHAVFLDACVLFPALVRRILLNTATAGLIRPHWSPRVLDEWQIAIARQQGAEAETDIITARAEMAGVFPAALIHPDPDLEASLTLPDPADAHVVAAAAGTDILITFNIRDFPRRTMAGLGVEVRHPDGFLWELWSHEPEVIATAVSKALDQTGIAHDQMRSVLKRTRLSRLGKAVAA